MAAVEYQALGNHIALVTLNRPEARNAVNSEVTQGLDRIISQTNDDPDIRTVVLTGTGTVFCAGADLRAVSDGRSKELSTDDGGFAGFVKARKTKTWICAANGPAVAGGLEILLACDLAISSDTARFGLPEPKRGLVAIAGGLFRLSHALPRAVAAELIATGDTIDATRALNYGLVSQLHPKERLHDAAMALAEKVAANAPQSVRESLNVARKSFDLNETELFAHCDKIARKIRNSADAAEGSSAFLERRTPVWTGK